MKRLTKKISWPFILLVVLWLPAIWYSIHTPYALVDDFSDWANVKIFNSLESFVDFLKRSFITVTPGSRYRPFMEFLLGVFWKISGTNYGLHHFLRLSIKFSSILFLYLAFINIVRNLDFNNQLKSVSRIIVFGIIFCFSFFPNCPEARLTPQELGLRPTNWRFFLRFV